MKTARKKIEKRKNLKISINLKLKLSIYEENTLLWIVFTFLCSVGTFACIGFSGD
jgi:hypothetical protein